MHRNLPTGSGVGHANLSIPSSAGGHSENKKLRVHLKKRTLKS